MQRIVKKYITKQLLFCCLAMFPTWVFSQISFLPYQLIPIGNTNSDVVCVADVNNDGLNDVVVGNDYYSDPINDFKILVYLQNNTGGLNAPIYYNYNGFPAITCMDIGDVNGDLLNDIVITRGDSIGIFFQNSSGSFNPMVSRYCGPNEVALKIGDLNNDGKKDIAVGMISVAHLKVFYQTSTGYNVATYPQVLGGGGNYELDIADMNNDGLKDIVYMVGNPNSSVGIYVFNQNISGTLDSSVKYAPAISTFFSTLSGIALGDLNNDGKTDAVATKGGNSPSSKLVLWFQDATTNLLQPPIELQAYDIPEPVEIADLNCDGRNEIIVAHSQWLTISYYEQDNLDDYNSFQNVPIPNSGNSHTPYSLSIGDINNDGKKDVVIANGVYGLVVLINNSSPTNIDTSYSLTNTTLFYSSGVVSSSTNYFETFIDTTAEYIITKTDYFEITTSYQIDSIRFDSIYITESSICGQLISDTTYHSLSHQDSIFFSIDTNLISTSIDSVLIEVEPPVIEPVIIVLPELVIPNTITPNGDGINDVWIIDNMEYYPNNELEIFNRNGSSIFKSTNYNNNWNGQYNGQDLPATTYYYVIDLGSKILKGDLSIIRE